MVINYQVVRGDNTVYDRLKKSIVIITRLSGIPPSKFVLRKNISESIDTGEKYYYAVIYCYLYIGKIIPDL